MLRKNGQSCDDQADSDEFISYNRGRFHYEQNSAAFKNDNGAASIFVTRDASLAFFTVTLRRLLEYAPGRRGAGERPLGF